MTLIERIKADQLAARKERATAKAAFLGTLLGEIETLAKGGKGELTDAVVVTMVKKFIKNADEMLKVAPEGSEQRDIAHREKFVLEGFLPKQLNEAEIATLIESFVADGVTNVGDAMKRLKTDHAGTYDGAVASRLLKARFA